MFAYYARNGPYTPAGLVKAVQIDSPELEHYVLSFGGYYAPISSRQGRELLAVHKHDAKCRVINPPTTSTDGVHGKRALPTYSLD